MSAIERYYCIISGHFWSPEVVEMLIFKPKMCKIVNICIISPTFYDTERNSFVWSSARVNYVVREYLKDKNTISGHF